MNDALGSCDAAGNLVSDASCSTASDPVGAANMFQFDNSDSTGSSDCSVYATALNSMVTLSSPNNFVCYGNVLIVPGASSVCSGIIASVNTAITAYYNTRTNACDSNP
jgi:hypothetical protein